MRVALLPAVTPLSRTGLMHKRFRFLSRSGVIGALAALGLGAAAHAAEVNLKGGAMLSCSGLPCVEVSMASGQSLKMLVDTGNSRSILDKGSAQKLGLELRPFVGRDGKVHPEYSSATLKGVRIGAAELGDVSVMVMNLAPEIEKGDMPATDGTLSYTAFGQRLLRLDYKRRRVELSDVQAESTPCPADCGTLTTPTFGAQGPPIVVTTGFSVNGQPVLVQVDTLYSGTMLIYPNSVEKLGLKAEQNSKTRRRFPFTDGGVEMIEGSASAEGFGNKTLARHSRLYFATPEVHTPDSMFDGTVGDELFAGHVLTFDFFTHHFWLS